MKRVQTLLHVPLRAVGILLRQYKWDADRLVDDLSVNSAEVARRCGVNLEVDDTALLKKYLEGCKKAKETKSASRFSFLAGGGAAATAAVAEPEDMCPACMNDVPAYKLVSPGCDHSMCSDCWQQHLSALLAKHGKEVHYAGRCTDCATVVPEALWNELATPKDLSVYRQYVIRSFIPLKGKMVWCPNPQCNKALRFEQERTDLLCACGLRFCVNCQMEAHSPCTCEEFEQWRSDCDGLKVRSACLHAPPPACSVIVTHAMLPH